MTFRSLARICAAIALVTVVASPEAFADVAQTDPAARQIATFTDTLLDTMRDARQLGVEGRYNRLKPVIEQTFDLPAMTRLAVGPSWDTMSSTEQQTLIGAFERMTLANYAANFDSFDGQKFVVDPNVQARNDDRIVQTTLVLPHSAPVALNYRMHDVNGSWKVVDVYMNGYVSELALRRSDFSSTLASGGTPALVRRINALSDKLLAGA